MSVSYLPTFQLVKLGHINLTLRHALKPSGSAYLWARFCLTLFLARDSANLMGLSLKVRDGPGKFGTVDKYAVWSLIDWVILNHTKIKNIFILPNRAILSFRKI